MKTLIKNVQIVNEGRLFKGSVLIDGDCIAGIAECDKKGPDVLFPGDLTDDVKIIDATGKILIPGVIDDQVHFRDPGLTHKADLYTETRASVAGGVTSIMDMPNTKPQTITNKLLREKQKTGSEKSLCNYSFYLGATNDNIEEIKKLDPLTTCGVKVFMGASTGNMLVDKREALQNIFAESPVLVTCHCEDEETVQNNLAIFRAKFGDEIPMGSHPDIRSREACMKSSSLAVELAKKYGTKLHILHLSTADEMTLFRNDIPLEEKKITAEVCVHHLWFEENDYREKASFIKWNPAIKKSSDRDELIRSVINDRIDIIATDHAPHTLEEKQNNYVNAPSGGPLIQHSLTAMLEYWHRGIMTLEKIVEKMCHNPAILFGIEKRGYIRKGYKADLCLFNPDSPWTVNKENIYYKCGWSPFEGQQFRSKVEQTWVNGIPVFDNGRFNTEQKGELLTFRR